MSQIYNRVNYIFCWHIAIYIGQNIHPINLEESVLYKWNKMINLRWVYWENVGKMCTFTAFSLLFRTHFNFQWFRFLRLQRGNNIILNCSMKVKSYYRNKKRNCTEDCFFGMNSTSAVNFSTNIFHVQFIVLQWILIFHLVTFSLLYQKAFCKTKFLMEM